MAARAGSRLRVAEADAPVSTLLRGRPGKLRGAVHITNETDRPMVTAAPVATLIDASRVQAVTFRNQTGDIVPAGSVHRMKLTASVDPRTPPGTYELQLDVAGRSMTTLVEVTEDVALSFTPSSVVIDGVVGAAGTVELLVTNRGNVPLPLSRLGPVDLRVGGARPSLLDQLLGRDVVAVSPTTIVEVHVPSKDKHDTGDEEPEAPTVVGTLDPPITLEPGESRRVAWAFEIGGDLVPGARYRVLAPCYTTDLEIIVVPHQEGAPTTPTTTPKKKAAASAAAPAPRPARSRGAAKPATRATKRSTSTAPARSRTSKEGQTR